MYQIILAVDEHEDRLSKQLEAIEELPGRDDISVTILYVHEEVDAPADEAGQQIIQSINENIHELQGVPSTVAQARDELDELNISVEVMTDVGDPATVIRDVAADRNANAICVAGRQRSPVGKAMFGSVVQTVILESDRPVIVAR